MLGLSKMEKRGGKRLKKRGSEEKQEENTHNNVEGGQIQPRRRGRNH